MKERFDYEIIIIGCGPAGIQAALHAGRRKHKILILGKPQESALWNAHIENYFGFPEKVEGKVLLEAGVESVKKIGVSLLTEDVIKIEPQEQGFKVITEKEKEFLGLSLILAMGVKRKKRIFKEEQKYLGKGVSYCADCDAWFYKGKTVCVVGEGSSAVHGAKLLKNFATRVFFYSLRSIEEDQKKELLEKGIEILDKKPVEILGEEEVKGIKLEDGSFVEVDGIFIEMGARGPLELLSPLGIELDLETFSYVKVDRKMKTNIEGVFACGDVTGPPLQLAKAVGEGCIAGLSASEYVETILKKSNSLKVHS